MTRRPIPKRQHFVAQMVLRRFTNAEGKLYYFDKRLRERGVCISKPENIFLVGHLYTSYNKNGTKDVTLESQFFNKLDGEADRIIEKIVTAARTGSTPNLSKNEKEIWDLFFYYQWKRVPDSFSLLEDFETCIQRALVEFEAEVRPLTPEEQANLQNQEVLKRIEQNARVKAIASPAQEVQQILSQKGLSIAIINKPNKSFVIGSFPIVKFAHPARTHLANPSVEVWFPVAHDVAVTPAALPPRKEQLVAISDDRHIRAINEAIFKQSTLIAGRSRELIASLAGCRYNKGL